MSKLSANARFEILADLFNRDTHMLAPGKSYPLPCTPPPDEEREDRWREWLGTRAWTAMLEEIHRLQESLEDA